MQFKDRFRRYAPLAALLAFALLLMQSSLFAQQTGQITGTVVDTTGAAIVNAKVILVDEATQVTRHTVTNSTGFFSFTAVMPATYDVKVEAQGFKTVAIPGVHMSPGDKRDVTQVAMSPGAAKEEVTVEAVVTGVDIVSSPEKSSLITATDIERQSIVGRNALELVRMLPGMTIRTASAKMDNKAGYDPTRQNIYNSPTGSYGMNGMGPQMGGTSVSSDGAQIIDVGDMGANIATVNMDMVQEVKVQTSNFSADTNRGPVVINAVGKSGTSSYHGSGYFYARNGALNANDWFNNANNIKNPDDRYYYPGGNIGGPVKIPGTNIDKKMFFFAGFEYYAQKQPQDTIRAQVPTDGMRKGDFSWNSMKSLCGPQMPSTYKMPDGTVVPWTPYLENPNVANVSLGPMYCITPTFWYDPSNMSNPGAAIVNGQLQPYMINAAGQAYMNMFPHANATPTAINNWSNYVYGYSMDNNSWQFHPRVDYNFNDSNKLYVTYNLQKEKDPINQALFWAPSNAMIYPGNVETQITSQSVTTNFLKVVNPTLTSETILGLTWYKGPTNLTDPKAVSRNGLAFPSVFDNGVTQIPSMWDWWPGGMPQVYMQSGFMGNSQPMRKTDYSIQENVTKVFASHTAKVGFLYERSANAQSLYGDTAGFMSYSPNPWQWIWSGPAGNYSGWQGCSASAANPACFNNIAMLLMGQPQHFEQDQKALEASVFYKNLGAYFTDNWKATRRLTLDLGVRYDRLTPWSDNHGVGMAVFDPKLYEQQVTVSGFTTGSNVQYPGMRWHATDPSVPVSGYDARWGFISPRLGLAWDMFGTGKWVLRGGWGAYRWHDGVGNYSSALLPGLGQHSFKSDAPYGGWTFDMLNAMASNNKGQTFGDSPGYFISPGNQQPLTNNWNLTISHPTIWNSFVEISYVGNESKHLLNNGNSQSINLIPIGGFYNKAFPTDALNKSTGKAEISGLTSAADIDWYRTYSWYNVSLMGTKRSDWANYHALQIAWNRTKGAVTYGLNYTFSKALGIYTDADPFNIQKDYGPLNIDRTHVVNMNYTFDLGTRVHGGNALLRGLANGWQIAGITQWQSGAPLQTSTGSNFGFKSQGASVQNTYNYNAAGNIADYVPNQLDPTVQLTPENILGTPDVALQPNVAAGCDPTWNNRAKNAYLNTLCWMIPDYMKNGPVYKGYFHSPGYFTSDLSTYKSFKIAEKKTLQFRASAFNLLNHPLRSFLDSDWTSVSLGNLNNPSGGFTPNQRLTPSDFYWNTQSNNPAYVGTPKAKYGRRVVQLAVKFDF